MGSELTRIVIADDDQMMLALVKNILVPLGWRIHTATNGTTAMQVISDTVPDLVISDINMPGLLGTDLLRILRSQAALSHIPVVLVSDAVMERQALEAGCDAFVAKHLLVKELLPTLRKLVR